MTVRWLAVPCFAVALSGCINLGGSADLRPMEAAIGAAASLGLSSTIAMSAIASPTAPACAQVTQACTAFPCANGAVTITLDSSCPLPLGGAATGTVDVTGNWTSATQATLTTTYTNVKAGASSTVVVRATSVTATPTSVMYTGQNVQVQGASAFAGSSTWSVSLDNMKRYTITGSQAAGSGGGAAASLDVQSVVLDPACTLNPVSGSASITNVGGLSVSSAHVTFHSACDGKADADGSSVKLNFFAM